MELSDFANKKFAIYGLVFHGDNIKVFGLMSHNGVDGNIQGHNVKKGKHWGYFEVRRPLIKSWYSNVLDDYGELIFDYNNPDNPWYIRKLVDRNFRTLSHRQVPCSVLGNMLGQNCYLDQDSVFIGGTAYWRGIKIGKFYMVELLDER